jgi:enoyl-CoA hydratase/carnithine racemase
VDGSIVEARDDAGIRVLRLARPKANAINAALVEALIAHLDAAARDDGVGGVLLESSQPGFFSAGFDLQEVFAYERPQMHAFFTRFVTLYERLLRLPKPVGGALSGHTVAGGAFLALCFDVRVLADGDFRFGVNEVTFGAIVPTAVTRLLIDVVGPRIATQMILSGEMVNPRRALEIGLVDAVVPAADVTRETLKHVSRLASKPRGAFGLAKRKLHEDLGHLATSQDPRAIEEFLDQWFSLECVALRRKIADDVLKRLT